MGKMSKRKNLSMTLFQVSDIIILILNVIILSLSSLIASNEKSFRGSIKLFLFQLIESILIIILDIIMLIKMFLSNYKGHNNYGMFIRFLLFYLNLSCIILTFQRSNNLNQERIRKIGNILLFIGLVNNGFIIISMILSIIVLDKRSFTKYKKFDDKMFNFEEHMEIFENDSSGRKVSNYNLQDFSNH